MNLFYLDPDTKLSVQMHCDKHVVKMILEYAQLLSTAHRMLDGEQKVVKHKTRNVKRWVLSDEESDEKIYKATHFNHPSSVWARQSDSNYQYLYKLFCDLCDEYTYRYNKVHLTDQKLRKTLAKTPTNIAKKEFVKPPRCMPDHCKVGSVEDSYREYYRVEKSYMTVWSKRPTPSFMN